MTEIEKVQLGPELSKHVGQAKMWTKTISAWLQQYNPFAKELRSMGEATEVAAVKFIVHPKSKQMDPRQLDSQELALMFKTNYTNDKSDLFATVILKEQPLGVSAKSTSVKYQSPFWEPLAYPLIFLHGQLGWGHTADNISIYTTSDGKEITLHQYTRYMLLHNPILSCVGHVCQAWVLELYLRDQHNTLDYIRANNVRLKKAPKSVVQNAVQTSNILTQWAMAATQLAHQHGDCDYDIKRPLSAKQKALVEYDSIRIENHAYHHDDNDESFTTSDILYLPGYTYLPASFPGGPRHQCLKFARWRRADHDWHRHHPV
jgi:hypothetical protein